jgi:hypothetical protein
MTDPEDERRRLDGIALHFLSSNRDVSVALCGSA